MKVDFHTHWGPAWTERDGLDPSKWLAMLDQHGISHAVVMGLRGLTHKGEVHLEHDEIAAVCQQSKGRMLQFLSVHPSQGREAVNEAIRCIEKLGVRGMKFHPWLQGESLAQPGMDKLAELAAERNLPMIFHDGTPPYSMPSQMAGLARRHPRTTIVLGHSGCLELWREALAAVCRYPNMWACLCGPHPAAFREFFRRADHARLLWGSDFGFGFHDPYGYRLGMIQSLGLNDSILNRVLAENPAQLLKLKN